MRLMFVGQLLGARVEEPRNGADVKDFWGRVRLDDGMDARWVYCTPRQAEEAEPLIMQRIRVQVDVFDRAKDGRMTMRLARDASIEVLPAPGDASKKGGASA